ncbi:MAG: N-acetyltransferase [Candidatus Aenigmarchaeota archaeon]|nr:N-acetyltransferase [Candidatus Aenigmarchaeota archaeon]
MKKVFIHPTASVSEGSEIGSGTKIWNYAQIREGTKIGSNCNIGTAAYIDKEVIVGNNVKIENGSFIYRGTKIEDAVFIGPGVIFTNDKNPRSFTPTGKRKTDKDWTCGKISVKRGASIGAGAIILPNVTIGNFAIVGAGSIVSKSVKDNTVVYGVPARQKAYVCNCGNMMAKNKNETDKCPKCVN